MPVPSEPSPRSISCREVVAALADYLEGALGFDVQGRLEAHLHGCVGCLAYVVGYRETCRWLRASHDEIASALPEALVQAILDSRRPSA